MMITQKLQQWGNGTGVRLPKKVIQAAHLNLNQSLAVTLQGSSIVLTPIADSEEVTLKSLLKGVTPTHIGGETDWGNDIGAEQHE